MPILNCIYLLVNKTAGLSALQSAIIGIAVTTGVQLGPIIAGFLLCSLGHVTIMYSVVISSVFECIILSMIALTISFIAKEEKPPPIILTDYKNHI